MNANGAVQRLAWLVAVLAVAGVSCLSEEPADTADEEQADTADAVDYDAHDVSDPDTSGGSSDTHADTDEGMNDTSVGDISGEDDAVPYEVAPYELACVGPFDDYQEVFPVLLPQCSLYYDEWASDSEYWLVQSEADLSALEASATCGPPAGGDITEVVDAISDLGVDYTSHMVVITSDFGDTILLGDGVTYVGEDGVFLRYDIVNPYRACDSPVSVPHGASQILVASVVPRDLPIIDCVRRANTCLYE